MIGALAKDTGRLRNGLDQLGKVRGLESAEKMAQAMVDPWQQFGAAVQALRIAFGQALIPILGPLMAKLTGVAQTLTRWSQLFPNITRVVSITALTILGITAAMSALTLAVGIGKMVWLGMITVWKVLTWTGYRSIAMFLFHTAMATAFVVSLVAMATWMGIVRGAMLLWQGAIWLVNAALLANPIVLIVVGVVALIAAVVAAAYYWDEWTSVALDIDPLRRVSAFDLTLTAPECALSLLNAQVPAGYSRAITLTLRQGSGANKVQWPSNIVWAYNRQPVLSYVPGAYDLVTLVYDPIAHNWRGMVDGGWFNV